MSSIRGVISLLFLIINTLFWAIPLYLLALLKLITPSRRLQLHLLEGLNYLAMGWIGANNVWIHAWIRPRWHISVPAALKDGSAHRRWWLVIANHRSWTDIFVLQYALHRRTPMPKFFLKQELIWVPVIGLAWWALEFPFMRRYSREQLADNPRLAARDREATRRICERARQAPMAIFNFVEGTRFTPTKHDEQQSPFTQLLRPRAGGSAQVINILGDRLSGILDATLDYRHASASFWGFLCGHGGDISVDIVQRPLEPWMLSGNYHADAAYRERFQQWLNQVWKDKDARLSRAGNDIDEY